MKTGTIWAPSVVLSLAALFTVGVDVQQRVYLRTPLDVSIPAELNGHVSRDLTISQEELEIAGVTTYLLRDYEAVDEAGQVVSFFSVYVGYYDSQLRGKTVHSPKNCLPGAGWEALESSEATISTDRGPIAVNRYLLRNEGQRAIVLYWYQGRGRTRANEYVVKWDLLRDAALHQRTEEALVRVVVPVGDDEEQAFQLAARAAASLYPALQSALPSWDGS